MNINLPFAICVNNVSYQKQYSTLAMVTFMTVKWTSDARGGSRILKRGVL